MRKAILTIDDSPTSLTTEVVAFLTKKDIECTFFCIGSKLANLPEQADKILQAGFEIGNHSYTHRAFSTLSFEECQDEIHRTEIEIERAYHRNLKVRSRKLFRFPYGDKGSILKGKIQAELSSRSFQNINGLNITYPWFIENTLDTDSDTFWTFDTLDYKLSDGKSNFVPQDLFDHIEETNPPLGGSVAIGDSDEIVLMHDNLDTSVKFPKYYEELIRRIEEKGIIFVKRAS